MTVKLPEQLWQMKMEDTVKKYSEFTWPKYVVDYIFKKYFRQKKIIITLVITNLITIGALIICLMKINW